MFGSAWSLCTNHHKFWLLHGQKKLQLSGWQLTIVLRDCKTNRRSTAVACLQSLLVACLRCLVRKCYTNWFMFTFDVCKVLGSGSLKENAEQIGHSVRHCGLRPSLAVMQQAVDSFFHLCLPRKHEVCSGMSASNCVNACCESAGCVSNALTPWLQ